MIPPGVIAILATIAVVPIDVLAILLLERLAKAVPRGTRR